jgi:gamma-glutamyltranspeptidase
MLLNGRAPKAGEIMTFPELAETFKAVAKEGKKGFYQGRIAEEIVRLVKDKGGCMTMEDLAAHETEKIEPITYSYQQANGVDVHEVGPCSQLGRSISFVPCLLKSLSADLKMRLLFSSALPTVKASPLSSLSASSTRWRVRARSPTCSR